MESNNKIESIIYYYYHSIVYEMQKMPIRMDHKKQKTIRQLPKLPNKGETMKPQLNEERIAGKCLWRFNGTDWVFIKVIK